MCLCVCVCLDINNVVHVPATFIATSHGGRSGRCNRHPIPPHSSLDPQLPRQRHLECCTQVYLRFLRPLLPMTFCLLKCKIYRSTAAAAAYTPTVHTVPLSHSPNCPQEQCAWLPLSKQDASAAASAASGFACFGHLQADYSRLD